MKQKWEWGRDGEVGVVGMKKWEWIGEGEVGVVCVMANWKWGA